jgi:pyruvate formate lyase activating enzyme
MAHADPTLAELLAQHTAPAELGEKLPDGKVRCLACAHRCLIPTSHDGICKVRFNRAGTLFAPTGYVAGLAVDPIEKKPFYHVLPGAAALSFGMLGCDLHCAYCQNWLSTQTLRDPQSRASITRVSPDQLVQAARAAHAEIVTSTYNEPLITSEWAVTVFRAARAAGLRTGYVSNGHATPEALDYLQPWLDYCKVDLKSFADRSYRQLGGRLEPVLQTIRGLWQRGIWVEVVTLVVPGFNDSEAELRDIARFLAAVSPDLPWHCTAFHPDYRMTDREPTPARTLVRACELGVEAGLRHVYAGNLPGLTREWENTRCPHCRATVIERRGFTVRSYRLTGDGKCPQCATAIAGRWRGGQ